jgi:opacity protein-like surface antigen
MKTALATILATLVAMPAVVTAGPYFGVGIGGARFEADLGTIGLFPDPILANDPGDPDDDTPNDIEVFGRNPDLTSTDVAFSFLAGWQFGKYFGVEVSYTDFGDARNAFLLPDSCVVGDLGGCQSREWTAEVRLDGVSAFVVGTLPLGESIDAFARVGAIAWDAELFAYEKNKTVLPGPPVGVRNDPVSFEEDGTDLAAGLGVNLKTDSPFSIRADFTYYDIDNTDLVYIAQIMALYSF